MDPKRLKKNSPLIRTRSFKENKHIFSGSRLSGSEILRYEVLIPPLFEVWTNLETTSEHKLL